MSARGSFAFSMYFIKRIIEIFIKWITGEYPLWVTYWLTGIVPQVIILLIIFTAIISGGKHELNFTPNVFLVLFLIVIAYGILSLFAITFSAIKYKGPIIWKILALLIVVKAVASALTGIRPNYLHW